MSLHEQFHIAAAGDRPVVANEGQLNLKIRGFLSATDQACGDFFRCMKMPGADRDELTTGMVDDLLETRFDVAISNPYGNALGGWILCSRAESAATMKMAEALAQSQAPVLQYHLERIHSERERWLEYQEKYTQNKGQTENSSDWDPAWEPAINDRVASWGRAYHVAEALRFGRPVPAKPAAPAAATAPRGSRSSPHGARCRPRDRAQRYTRARQGSRSQRTTTECDSRADRTVAASAVRESCTRAHRAG